MNARALLFWEGVSPPPPPPGYLGLERAVTSQSLGASSQLPLLQKHHRACHQWQHLPLSQEPPDGSLPTLHNDTMPPNLCIALSVHPQGPHFTPPEYLLVVLGVAPSILPSFPSSRGLAATPSVPASPRAAKTPHLPTQEVLRACGGTRDPGGVFGLAASATWGAC